MCTLCNRLVYLIFCLAREKDEEILVLPNEGEVQMLSQSAVLSFFVGGRPQTNGVAQPNPRLQHEQELILVRLYRVRSRLSENKIAYGVLT